MKQWAGRLNGGSSCWWAESRKKSEKNWGELWRPLGQYLTHQHLSYNGPRGRREKESHWEHFLIYYSWKLFQHGKGNSQLSSRNTESPIQDKPKEKHVETHNHQQRLNTRKEY